MEGEIAAFADRAEKLIFDKAAEVQRLTAENERLRGERDLWQSRALAMFWKLPGDMTVGELQDDAKRALEFVRANQQSEPQR